MRFLGTLLVELTDGTTVKFKDRARGRWDERNQETQWWTHTFEKDADESLVITRLVASVDSWQAEGTRFNRSGSGHHLAEHVAARYQSNEWRRAQRRLPK